MRLTNSEVQILESSSADALTSHIMGNISMMQAKVQRIKNSADS